MSPAEKQQSALPRPRIFYGWWMLALAGMVIVVTTVPFQDALVVWAVALEQQFDWSRIELSLGLTLSRLIGLAAPAVGYLSDRFGPRRMVLIGIGVVAAGTVFFGMMQGLWGFYVAMSLIAIGQMLGGSIPLVILLSRWFLRRRSTAIALLLMAPSVGGFVLVPVIAYLVNPDDAVPGWRLVVFALAALTLIAAISVFALLRNRPEEMGLLPDGVPPAVQSVSFSLVRALRTPAFWLITLGDALASMTVVAIMHFLGSLMSDQGFAVRFTAWVVVVHSGASVVFYLVGGISGDRMPKRIALAVFASIQAIGILGLALANSVTMFLALAVILGAGYGGRSVLAIAILPDYFGTDSLGKILGLSGLFSTILLVSASPITGLMIDWLGGYSVPFMILAGINLLVAYLFLQARPTHLSELTGRPAT